MYKTAHPKILFSAVGIRDGKVRLWKMERNVEDITCRENRINQQLMCIRIDWTVLEASCWELIFVIRHCECLKYIVEISEDF